MVECTCGAIAQLSIRGNCNVCGRKHPAPSNPNPQAPQKASRKPRNKVKRSK